MMEGTFEGSLTAGAINAVKNINLKSGSVATTTISKLALANPATHGFNDDQVWRSIHNLTFVVPTADESGGWVSTAIQYLISDQKGDNDLFPTQMRILLDGQVVYTSPAWSRFMYYYRRIKEFFHEIVSNVTSPGAHTVTLQFRWADAASTMAVNCC